MKPTSPANPASGKGAGRTPRHTFLRTWRNMAIISLPMGWMTCAAAGDPAWYAWLFMPLVCLGGPVSLLLVNQHALPAVAGYVGLYGLGVAWFFWKPSGWSKTVFILFSVLWLLLGCGIASIPV